MVGRLPVWAYPLLLLLSGAIGMLAVPAGVGGGVLFVPVVASCFPFHVDFVRCAGLVMALSCAVAAGPTLLRTQLADFRLALPIALVTSACAILGALAGLALAPDLVRTLLGAVILLAATWMLLAGKRSYRPRVPAADPLARALRIGGLYTEPSTGEAVSWTVHRTPLGLVMFTAVGFIAGLFGLGAGWANVPVLNLVMGAPIKMATATSQFVLAVTDSSAAWVYINEGALLPLILVPSAVGMIVGSSVSVRIFGRMKPPVVRAFVLTALMLAGALSLLRGLGAF
jgi:hypothetical protein